jgi:hypothetical protein
VSEVLRNHITCIPPQINHLKNSSSPNFYMTLIGHSFQRF